MLYTFFISLPLLISQVDPATPNDAALPQESAPTLSDDALPIPDSANPAEPPPVTNSGEPFKDPFEAPNEAAPSVATPPPVPAEGEAIPPVNPPEQQAPVQRPSEVSTPSDANAPVPGAIKPAPVPPKDFSFPEVDKVTGPVTEEVVQRESYATKTPVGAITLGMNAGMGANLNRRPQQLHFDFSAGYRYWPNAELGLNVYYRTVTDQLLGTMIVGKYFWRLPTSRRIDIDAGGGLGWTLRAPHSKFSEGRFTARLQSDVLFYAVPWFALVGTVGMDTYIFALSSGGKGTNLMKSGGPPTQAILSVGIHFEF